MSINPYWVAKILNGEKTIEVRRKFPKDYRGWVYIYCTKSNKYECLEYADNPDKEKEGMWVVTRGYPYANGKIVARFKVGNVENILNEKTKIDKATFYYLESEKDKEFAWRFGGQMTLCKLSGMDNYFQLHNYLNGEVGFAIHISQLEVFDPLLELNNDMFMKRGFNDYYYSDHSKEGYLTWANKCESYKLVRPPQSYEMIEVYENETK